MLEVVYENRYISVFIEDVCKRGERVDQRSAGST
jgi:hypothetical protein